MAGRSKAWVCGRSLAGIASSNPAVGMDVSVCCECCVLLGRGQCDELITSPEESYQVWCLSVIVKPQQYRGPEPLGAVASGKEDLIKMHSHITSVTAFSVTPRILHSQPY